MLDYLESLLSKELNLSLSLKQFYNRQESEIAKKIISSDIFRMNLLARLKRIVNSPIYEQSITNLTKKIELLFDSKNLEGAYNEIVGYYFLSISPLLLGLIEIEKNVDSKDTFSNKNKDIVNFDGYLISYKTYFDVKTLCSELENTIVEKIKRVEGLENLICYLERDVNEIIDKNFPIQKVIDEAKELIPLISSNEFYRSKSQIIEGLVYEKKQLVHITTSQSSPYKQSLYFHDKIFKKDSKNILKNAPCIMFYVNSNFNSQITSGLGCHDKIFYYDFARRVFCQYQSYKKKPNLSEEETNEWEDYCEKSKHISAIIFIEDRLRYYQKEKPDMSIYLFRNPNAKNPISDILWNGLTYPYIPNDAKIEFFHDFYYDNY